MFTLKSILLASTLLLNSVPPSYPVNQQCSIKDLNVTNTLKDITHPYVSISGAELNKFKEVWYKTFNNRVPDSDLMLLINDVGSERTLIAIYKDGCSTGAIMLPSEAVKAFMKLTFGTETST